MWSYLGPGKKGQVQIKVDGESIAEIPLARTVPAAFTASESLDVGVDLGSSVVDAYAERRPFPFSGKIRTVKIHLD
ncbi:MAG: hypothetical protein FJ308_21060 [Planctomycetes bacterium]|nr:hypothetical protein [Planctomycetota bacterium]